MCGRFTTVADPERLAEEFGLVPPADYVPRYNIAPTQPVLVVHTADDVMAFGMFRWGLIPYGARDVSVGNRMINARAETLESRAIFRACFERRRCLVVADGFYEWERIGRRKQPVYIRRVDGRPFAFAGIWDNWRAPDGEPVRSCSIITTEPNALVLPIHDRMPVLLLEAAERDAWLERDASADALRRLLAPAADDVLEAYDVSPAVNDPRNDGPECIEPFERPAGPELELGL